MSLLTPTQVPERTADRRPGVEAAASPDAPAQALRAGAGADGHDPIVRDARPSEHGAEPGHVPGRGRLGPDDDRHDRVDRQRRRHRADRLPGVRWRSCCCLTVLFANFAEALAEARGKAQAQSLRATRQDTLALSARAVGRDGRGLLDRAQDGRPRGRRGRPGHPGRRRDRRGRGLGRRVGDHRRERAGDPRGRRRPLGRHRRHAGPLRPDRRRGHRRAPARASSTG